MARRAPILVGLAVLLLPAPAIALRGGAFRGPGWIQDVRSPGGGSGTDDIRAFWFYWFENNKEWILESRAAARRASSEQPVDEQTKKTVALPAIISALGDENLLVRDAAVIALGKFGGPEVAPHLVAARDDESAIVREDALLALGLTREPRALAPLVVALRSGDEETVARAALGLALLGEESPVPALLDLYTTACEKRKDELACALATAIGFLGTEEDANRLCPSDFDTKRGLLAVHVCDALGRLGGPYAEKWLDALFDAPGAEVKAAAALALPLTRAEDRHRLERRGVKSKTRSVRALSTLALALATGRLPERRGARRNLVRSLSRSAVTPADVYVAQFAALGLGLIGEPEPVKHFREYVRYEEQTRDIHRSAICIALALLGDHECIPDLREIVRKDGYDPDLRGYAALSLALLSDRDSREVVVKSMKRYDKRIGLLRSGCWALGLIGTHEDLPLLFRQMERRDARLREVRGAAVAGIGLLADRRALPPLLEILEKNEDATTRALAVAAIGWLCDKDPVPRIPGLFRNVNYRRPFTVQREVMSIL